MAKNLRVATAEDSPRPPLTVLEAAESGSRLDELVAIRLVLARAVDSSDTSPRDLAALTRRQIEVSREIESLRAEVAEDAREAAKSNVVTDKKWRPEAI